MKKISILGATGSVGSQALEVISNNPESFSLCSISAGRNIEKLEEIITTFKPALVSVVDDDDRKSLASKYADIEFLSGKEGLLSVARDESDMLLTAIMGSIGLEPTLAAIESGKDIALANKETLVAAGEIVMERAKEKGVSIVPVDSEHSAVFQCLRGEKLSEMKRIILTASGGSFRDLSREELADVTLEMALDHPNWSMGRKITIDSATMMNKGLEVIEAKWLFDADVDQISTILHRESTVHSMVEFTDNSIMAQMGTADMKTAIQFAFSHPDRLPMNNPMDLDKLSQLNFKPMDLERFKMLQYAYDALRTGGTMPAVMNAANEYAVAKFLDGEISFTDIEKVVELRMDDHNPVKNPDLETILYYDRLYKSDMR
ncbi:1-deoxy-D-xylulose-5-phosphate reductoisomerase [Salinicoccus halodurans]|uniref:1-deoxy-D-xylulose 5-phosphate reductoisomerase n=1 Tax=Salinicoccus halodurans TaxID=407035 RepID=A0A0F7HKX6_9STAP|nr:1-deoxy-D-xylulose-5-phosphate reductoisomerase [Salinicoccus halodurans]AKG73786.1 1-deoxy-D-xylulose 5-phosphate reductoisomerase [Salinicoccus halodurans]SFK55874.1 1-deoxy-D-xylulose 5-phosphate reductoisomerase [Salinicoccus halodurans]